METEVVRGLLFEEQQSQALTPHPPTCLACVRCFLPHSCKAGPGKPPQGWEEVTLLPGLPSIQV